VEDVTSAADVFAALNPRSDEAFVSLALSDTGGWVFLLRNGTIAVLKITIGVRQIAELVRRVRAGIEPTGNALPGFDVAASRELYDVTLGGVASSLVGVTSLVVAPGAGPLLSLPFAVLLSGPADPNRLSAAPFLVRQFAIVHVPAPSSFVSLRKTSGGPHAGKPWLGFGGASPVTLAQAERTFPSATCSGNAKLLTELQLLPAAPRELDAARLILGALPGDEFLGQAFTADAVKRADLRPYGVLHFAGHELRPTDLDCLDGASRWRVYWRVIVPLSLPGVLNALLIQFNLLMGAFVTVTILGGGKVLTFPVLIQRTLMMFNDYGLAAALSAVLLLIVLIINFTSIVAVTRLRVASFAGT
jgi:hypothetical protein